MDAEALTRRDCHLYFFADLKQPSSPDKPHNSGNFYRFVNYWGKAPHEVNKIIDHRPGVIVHENQVVAIVSRYFPAVVDLPFRRKVVSESITKEGLTLSWLQQWFQTVDVDAIRCSVRSVPRFYLVNPKHAESVLPEIPPPDLLDAFPELQIVRDSLAAQA